MNGGESGNEKKKTLRLKLHSCEVSVQLKSVQSALSDLKRLSERLQSQCNYRPFIT